MNETEVFGTDIESFAEPGHFPSVVSILYDDRVVCAGSILNPFLILTAALCIRNMGVERLTVFPGLNDTSSLLEGITPIPVDASFTGREFGNINFRSSNTNTYRNDIAIVQLRYPLQFNSKVRNVALPTKYSEFVGSAMATGFRYSTLNSSYFNDVLTNVSMPIMPYELCRRKYFDAGWAFTTDNMLCGDATGLALCQNNITQGGPIMCGVRDNAADNVTTWVQCGILTENWQCKYTLVNNRPSPGLYTKVAHHVDWIKYIERKIKLGLMTKAVEEDLGCLDLQRSVDVSIDSVQSLAKKLDGMAIPGVESSREEVRPIFGGLCRRSSNTPITVSL